MVVLDQHHVKQPETMIPPAAAGHRIFFETPPAWSRFARIENLGLSPFDGFDKLRRQGGDAGKALNKIQRDAFSAEDWASRALNLKQDPPGLDTLAVLNSANQQ